MKNGFTLAEVLITLGIIGVVAAMTMPSLIAHYQNKVYETQSKKAQTTLANGIKKLMADEEVTDLNNTTLSSCTTRDCIATEMKKVFNIMYEIPADGSNAPEQYNFTDGDFPIWSDANLAYGFITSDGIMFGVKAFEEGSSGFTIVTDLNGNKRPNKGGKDLCKYTIGSTGTLTDYCSSMESCSGTASNPTKYYSWGMQSAEAITLACEDCLCPDGSIDYGDVSNCTSCTERCAGKEEPETPTAGSCF